MKNVKINSKNLSRYLKRKTALFSAVCLLGIGGIGGSLAYLKLGTDPVQNTFTAGKVDTEIFESFNGQVKKDVLIKNEGSVPVYVRVMLQINWVSANGNEVSPITPVAGTDYEINLNLNNGWIESGGYYYYSKPVKPGDSTGNLINSITQRGSLDGYVLNVDVLSQSIQAYPTDAVVAEWGFVPGNSSDSGVTVNE